MDSFETPTTEDDLYESLTPAQLAAVQCIDGPLLMLAGPGSGKTRVITHRIAHMLRQGIPARQILALTFTNKAADEMRLRLERLAPRQPVWLGTFHRFCARLLRQYATYVGLKENFSIYDAKDSVRALKAAVEVADVDLSYTSIDAIATAISRAKSDQITAEQFTPRSGSPVGHLVAQIYPEYQRLLLDSNAVDFDDLLLYVVSLLRENPELRASLDERYQYILVDEYQDTNLVQYAIARSLSVDHPNLAVAGDPDQSIYGWRGANLSNILDFEHDYPSVRVVRLEQNYRSTPNILRVADQLISYNVRRKKKALFTDRPEGAPVRLAVYPSARDEADDIAHQIAEHVHSGRRKLRDFAIFYRVNALSRQCENALRALNLPYQVVKGTEFYQRKEIKDILAYLHLFNNPDNEVALKRIINTPPRKIGKKTLERLTEHARRYRVSLLQAVRERDLIDTLAKSARGALTKFLDMYDRLARQVAQPLYEIMRAVMHETGYYDWLEQSEAEEDQDRLDNLDELLTDASEYDEEHDEDGLDAFLEQTSLVSDADGWEQEIDRVTLMTMHAAKGLEFPSVFIVAVEQGYLPHERNLGDSDAEEEERRLLFVGITRAEEELQLSLAHYRARRGVSAPVVPSHFLNELPRQEMKVVGRLHTGADPTQPKEDWQDEDYLQDDPGTVDFDEPTISDEYSQEPVAVSSSRYPPEIFQPGMIVDHPEYGHGSIVAISGRDHKRTATVSFFGDGAEATFRLAFSPLRPVGDAEG